MNEFGIEDKIERPEIVDDFVHFLFDKPIHEVGGINLTRDMIEPLIAYIKKLEQQNARLLSLGWHREIDKLEHKNESQV